MALQSTLQSGRVIGALIMREMTTRFGRGGLGFAWLIVEPALFCLGVLTLWTLTKPEYEHGVRLAPFVVTGYMSLILIRHFISLLTSAIGANIGLLYHRHVKPVHILGARIVLELSGATIAFIVVYGFLWAVGQTPTPSNILLIYAGWFTMAWSAMGLGLILTGLVMRYEFFERIVGLVGYLMIPLSGAFFMVAWIPEGFRKFVLLLPFVHSTEMLRAGVFGEFVETFYSPYYAIIVGGVMNLIGLLIIYTSIDRIEVE